MADAIGYTVLRKAVSLARVQQAAAAIDSGLTALVARDKFTEFQVPTVGYAVRDEFIKVKSCVFPYLC